MIPYNQASQKQKDNFFDLIKSIFNYYIREGEKHYHVNKGEYCIIVKESAQKPPPSSLQECLLTIVSTLSEMGLLNYKIVSLPAASPSSDRFFSSSRMIIYRVNTELMDSLLDTSPEEIPIVVPDHIQKYMSDFSSIMQAYITKCLQENLREEHRFSTTSMDASMVLMSILPSPITLNRRLEIPVRLPNAHLGVSNEHYDLVELLNLHQNYDGTRNDPITRQPFNLGQIIPAPDILEKIKSRLLEARNLEPSAYELEERSDQLETFRRR